MRLLFPPHASASELSPERLAELYAPPADAGPWVRANFVSTLDGAATGSDGLSGSINGDADQLVFNLLRALADVVLVGSGTVAAEGYGPIVLTSAARAATGRSAAPVLAVVSKSLDLSEKVLTPRPDGGLVVVLCPSGSDPGRRSELEDRLGPDTVIEAGQDVVDPGTALAALAERGLTQVLCEGGPTLLGALTFAGRLDELCLTWSPLAVGGSGPRILNGAPVDVSWELGHLIEQDSTLIARWVVNDRQG